MVTNKIIYKCDVCNNEAEDADIFFTNILVPVKTYEHMSSSYSIAYRKLDMCKRTVGGLVLLYQVRLHIRNRHGRNKTDRCKWTDTDFKVHPKNSGRKRQEDCIWYRWSDCTFGRCKNHWYNRPIARF